MTRPSDTFSNIPSETKVLVLFDVIVSSYGGDIYSLVLDLVEHLILVNTV